LSQFVYHWSDPKDRPDVYDRFTRAAEGPLPINHERPIGQRGQPISDAELADFRRRGGEISWYPAQPARKRRVPRSLILKDFAQHFDPLDRAPEWVAACGAHLHKIKPTSSRNVGKAARARPLLLAC
jgi:hypothetical protein